MPIPSKEELFNVFEFKQIIEKTTQEFIDKCITEEDFFMGLDAISNIKHEDPFVQNLLDLTVSIASSYYRKNRRKSEVNA